MLRGGARHTELNHTGKAASPQCKYAGEIQILSDDDRMVPDRMIEDEVVEVTGLANVRPVGGRDVMRREEFAPARREVFVDNDIHEANS